MEASSTSLPPTTSFSNEDSLEVPYWNTTAFLEKLPMLCTLALATLWVVYITYYNSRILGFILTRLLNHFFHKGYIRVGSISISVLSGKIMFRDVAYIDENFTLRVQDGLLIFRWWYPYVQKEITEDFSHSDTRISLLLNGLELHVYNRSQLYSRLEQYFGLEPLLIPKGGNGETLDYWQDSAMTDTQLPPQTSTGNEMNKYEWRDLIPVIKMDISAGRLVFGNKLVPTSLSINFEEAHLMYTTRPASSRLDYFTHICKCKAENFKIILAPSPKYIGLSDEPPRFMGVGFVVLQSNLVDLYYYQDEPGLVGAEPEVVELANGDIVQQSTVPCWGLDIKCGKGTDFSYGPWADRQREQLYKFFFPQDFQPLSISKQPQVGEKRVFESFDIRLSTLAEATIDILFSKEKETNAVHMAIGPGSYLEITLPWVTNQEGYSTHINGQLLHLEASTSLQYRALVESETLEFDVVVKYPRIWNEHQSWTINFTGCKATVHLIYAHKSFFHALIEDWASKNVPDLLHFTPYTWHFSLILKEFELITLANQYNWIDCSSQHQENAYLAVCGELFDLSFDLPFTDFLPPTVDIKFWIQGESVYISLFLPEANPNRDILLMLERYSKLTARDGSLKTSEEKKGWFNHVDKSNGWVECWTVPIVALSISYTYHPLVPLLNTSNDLDITTPEKEELLLSPIRPNGYCRNRRKITAPSSEDFDPASLAPDIIHLELEVGPSILCLYGSLLCYLMYVKENYLGENQKFTDFDSSSSSSSGSTKESPSFESNLHPKEFDPRVYRPLEVTVSVTLHDIHGHLMKDCSESDPPCPSLYLERLGFELHKTYRETRLQLLLSPLVLSVTDTLKRLDSHSHLKNGHLALSALQVRGHAMFSGVGRPLDSETLEYAWLVEVQMGDLTGRVTLPQLCHLASALEIFAFQVLESDFVLQPPMADKLCQHDVLQSSCYESTESIPCPAPDDIKYRLIRLSLDAIDVCIVESGTALELEIYPFRLATCNLHGGNSSYGLSILLQNIHLRQHCKMVSNLGCSSAYSISSHNQNCHLSSNHTSETWLEVGGVSLGPIYIDAMTSLLQKSTNGSQQESFLRVHDAKTKRLWFLWPSETNLLLNPMIGKCGCVGGCTFFGNNKNGLNFFRVADHTDEREWNLTSNLKVINDDHFGFGESILHKGEFVFDIPDNTHSRTNGNSPSHSEGSFVFAEGYISRHSPKTPDNFIRKHSESEHLTAPKHVYPSPVGSFKDDNINHQSSSNDAFNGKSEHFEQHSGNVHSSRRFLHQYNSPSHPSFIMVSPHLSAPLNSENNGNDNNILFEEEEGEEKLNNKTVVLNLVKDDSPFLSQNRMNSRVSLNGNKDASSSRHSLANMTTRGYSPRSVRRALSIESTHSSDLYLSADEDVLSSSNNIDALSENGEDRSRHPPSKNSTVNSGHSLERKIVSNNRRSLHDIQELPSQQSSDGDHSVKLQRTPSCGTHHDPSDSNSVSSTSFISAMSSQEDIALVDLHNQMNKPILESPLLMSCYTAHMTQSQCLFWQEPPPLPHLTQHVASGMAVKDHGQWKPRLSPLTEGFTTIRMVDKSKVPGYALQYGWCQKMSSQSSKEEEFLPGSLQKDVTQNNKDEKSFHEQGSISECQISLAVKLKGDIHIMLSPLFIESLKSFVDALTPTLSSLHPLTIINHLHFLCSHKIQHQNQLKKEKVLHLERLRNKLAKKNNRSLNNLQNKQQHSDSPIHDNNIEETKIKHLRASIHISKINVSVIQAAIVEEVISFSALDNLKDLTCVSLLAVCIDSFIIQLLHNHQAKKAIQTFTDSPTLYQKIPEKISKKAKSDSLPTELVTIESTETQQEEIILSATITCVHVQLRRLKNSSSILKEAIITSIPYHRSKVEFTFEKIPQTSFNFTLPHALNKQDISLEEEWGQSLDEDKMGFIMFEVGFEDISVKFIKRKGFNSKKSEMAKKKNESDILIGKSKDKGQETKTSNSEPSPTKGSQKSDNSGASWDTKLSFPSGVSECSNESNGSTKSTLKMEKEKHGDTTSFFLELKTVWFNFAAPPHTPNTRKIDFTRLDWHLLSTATPSINAWLKPSDRFAVSSKKIHKEMNQRISSVIACLMVEALDAQNIHMPVKSKYLSNKLTPFAKTLQEDPSCQLLVVLRRYIKQQENLESIEANLLPDMVPPMKTLHRGLIALSRQWKNILYMPLLVEQNMRFRKNVHPINLSFAVPCQDSVKTLIDDGEKVSLDECMEVTDETTNLLSAEGGSLAVGGLLKSCINDPAMMKSFSSPETGSSESQHQEEEGFSSNALKGKKKFLRYPPRTTRASIAFPLLGGPLDSPGRYAGMMHASATKSSGFLIPQSGGGLSSGLRMHRNDSKHSLKSTTWSLSSNEPNIHSSSFHGTPKRIIDSDDQHDEEDLYNWMARQQDYIRHTTTSPQKLIEQAKQDSKLNTGTATSDNSVDGDTEGFYHFSPYIPLRPMGIQLADAQVIFEPILSSLGVSHQKFGPILTSAIGPKLSISGTIELLKMDIVESEYYNCNRYRKKVHRSNTHGKFFIDTSPDTPTFICDKLSLDLELHTAKDYNRNESSYGIVEPHNTTTPIFYGSYFKLKTRVINFDITANFVAQQINMPLLRLLHQFSTMYENVKETQLELKANRPSSLKEAIKLPAKPIFSPSKGKGPEGGSKPHSPKSSTISSPKPSVRTNKAVERAPPSPAAVSLSLSESMAIDGPDKEPRCWRTMIYLLDLYDTMPETKTVAERLSSVAKPTDVSDGYKGNGKYEPLKENHLESNLQDNPPDKKLYFHPRHHHYRAISKGLTHHHHDWVPFVVFGVARIRRARILAMMSGLKLEGELNGFHSSLTNKERVRNLLMTGGGRRWHEFSLTGKLGHTMVLLLEGIAPNQQTVVKMTVGKSQALYSSQSKKGKSARNSALITIGPVNFDIPQHPVVLHGMMTRSTRQLSSTLQELRSSRQPVRPPPPAPTAPMPQPSSGRGETATAPSSIHPHTMETGHYQSCVLSGQPIKFSILLDSVTLGAALLPSLHAQYQIGQVTSIGVTGHKAKFDVDLPQHTLSFATKVPASESNLPSSASVDLPPVHISAEYVQQQEAGTMTESFIDGVVLCRGSYLDASAEIGAFEHSLTTDLLNHLVLVQKVFMKEVNEVVQKMSGSDKPVPFWGEEEKTTSIRRLLFSLELKLKGIQITATTPTSSAVRLETGMLEFQLSNRVQNMASLPKTGPSATASTSGSGSYMKLFGKAQVELNLALGQLIKNPLFEEAEPEFQQFAYFKTRICMRNAVQDEMTASQYEDKEAVLITLNRPLIYIQPIAMDRAVLVWLNYKNAYEYWNEQRASLNKEVLTATQQVFQHVPQFSQLGSQALGTLFLQLTVDDMGICLPLNPFTGNISSNKGYDTELKAAVVVTLVNTQISACSCGLLVSNGRFNGLCIRFADDFETSLDDWKPDPEDSSIMNLCVVSKGTYEICSRTHVPHGSGNAKWILNVQWQMEGVDIHVDTNIGKQLSALFKTLTTLTGEEDEEVREPLVTTSSASVQEPITLRKGSSLMDSLPSFFTDPNLDSKKRSRLIEKEMNEQAKIINDLRLLGASQNTIEHEVRRLHELETAVFNDFRRDVIKRLRRQSVKATSIKDKLGLGPRPPPLNPKFPSFSLNFPDDTMAIASTAPIRQNTLETVESPSSSQDSPSSPSHGHTRTASLDMSDLAQTLVPPLPPDVYRDLSLDSVFAASGNTEAPTSPTIHVEPPPKDTESYYASSERVLEDIKKGIPSAPQKQQPPPEPNVDFELDVKVFFNSGKCVLHTKDFTSKDDDLTKRPIKKERSFSGGILDLSSPTHSKKRQTSCTNVKNNMASSSSRLRYLQQTPMVIADSTIFLIPGLDVKVHYNSKTISGDSPVLNMPPPPPSKLDDDPSASSSTFLKKSTSLKKASLFAWITLQSIPEETVISPHILDFLEQALEPIPIQYTKPQVSEGVFPSGGGSSKLEMPTQYAYASFPVDVIVYLRMQPSILRFSCLPVSRVECLLRLPSLDLVFSSKRAEEDLYAEAAQPPQPRSRSPSNRETFPPNHSPGRPVLDSFAYQTAVGGLSMTGCLADFSLYIFHPYGGAKKGSSVNSKESAESSPLASTERKDSLSLQVEFVKLNISRSRKITLTHSEATFIGQKRDSSGAVIRFSAICDIGSASFKYDMRRLTEILAFPKAWYRRSIARRMFLGDQSTAALYSDQEEDTSSSSGTLSSTTSKSELLGPPFVHATTATTPPPVSTTSQEHSRLWLNLPPPFPQKDYSKTSPDPSYEDLKNYRSLSSSNLPNATKQTTAWETLVLFAVNLSRLNIHMNMGNVMGNTTWQTRDFKSTGRLSIGSSGHRNLFVSLGLDGSMLDSKGGIVGGIIQLDSIHTAIHLREEWGQEPIHTLALHLWALEARLDYMGTSVLLARVSALDVSFRDEWRITADFHQLPTRRPALIYIYGDLGWDQLQLMISKSTTPDIFKMVSKLEEFFSQQFHSSKRVFSSLNYQRHSVKTKTGPPPRGMGRGPKLHQHGGDGEVSEARHHRHWQGVLSTVSGLHMSTLPRPLPIRGTILGGNLELHGNNISLACFHGINFRSKAWALFSMKEPLISFATEAQDITTDDGSTATHIVQNLSFRLGHHTSETAYHTSMATVCRISRNVLFPPQFRTMNEWFHYAFATSELDEVGRFPVIEHDFERKSQVAKNPEFDYNTEIIFALPSLQLHLKTEHMQGLHPPSSNDPKPIIQCSFVTEFDDHIFVAVDAEAFFFLHDLITSYVKEKDRGGGSASGGGANIKSPERERKVKLADPIEAFQKDWRDFNCHTWHLEPTVRILSWAGKGIEPYGVDYILQKLGFSHARVTIPKWMQRGCMDLLDKILALAMARMLSAASATSRPDANATHDRSTK